MAWDARIRRRLKLRDLDTFLAVARSGSMAKAAIQLAVSQPSVSNAIADIERTLGVRLFDRLPQGVELTPYGHALIKSALVVFDDVRQGVQQIEFLADPTAGELRIGTTDPMIAGILPAVLSQLSGRYPRVVFQVMQVPAGTQQVRDLRERHFDLFFGRVIEVMNQDDLTVERLFEDPVFVAASARNPLARRRRMTLTEVTKEPWTLPGPNTTIGGYISDMFRACGLDTPPVTIVCNSIQMQRELLEKGRFLTLFPRSVLRFSARPMSIKVLPIELPALLAPVGIVTLKNRTISPVARLFIECARRIAKPLT
jgi:DNA-binding transcriptional LysR family regulator